MSYLEISSFQQLKSQPQSAAMVSNSIQQQQQQQQQEMMLNDDGRDNPTNSENGKQMINSTNNFISFPYYCDKDAMEQVRKRGIEDFLYSYQVPKQKTKDIQTPFVKLNKRKRFEEVISNNILNLNTGFPQTAFSIIDDVDVELQSKSKNGNGVEINCGERMLSIDYSFFNNLKRHKKLIATPSFQLIE